VVSEEFGQISLNKFDTFVEKYRKQKDLQVNNHHNVLDLQEYCKGINSLFMTGRTLMIALNKVLE
jgi:hypothetical protein